MVKKEYPRIGESLYHGELVNGLHVYVDVKPEFSKSYAFFATNYGGMDMRFQLNGEWHDTPAGVAHFLEHKMFDTKDGNALQDLAANGASPNAFTSSAITGYYFESTEKFEENLKILLSFVSEPWFTPESVDKEQGIIGQEIRMIEDDPENQVFYGMMETLYVHNPIKVSIAGTVESFPTSQRIPCMPAMRRFIIREIWSCVWRAMWTQSASARSPGRSCPGRGLRISQGITAGKSRRRPPCRKRFSGWRSPHPFSNWAGRRTPLPWGRSACAVSLWGSWPVKLCSAPPPPFMRACTERAWSTRILDTAMRRILAVPSWPPVGRAGTRGPCGTPSFRRRSELVGRASSLPCGTG